MSSKTAQQVIRDSKLFRCGYQLTPSIAKGIITAYGLEVSLDRAKEILQTMAMNGELTKTANGWRKASNAGEWIRKAWRTKTNEQIGIVF